MKLSITAATAATATVTIPLASPVWSTTVAITANGEAIVTIPSSTGAE